MCMCRKVIFLHLMLSLMQENYSAVKLRFKCSDSECQFLTVGICPAHTFHLYHSLMSEYGYVLHICHSYECAGDK